MKTLILMLLLSSHLIAESRAVPLMFPRDFASYKGNSLRTSQRETSQRTSLLGVELGSILKSTSSKSDLLGMNALIGGRMFLRLPVSDRFYFRPSLGYFRRSENKAIVSVTQHSVEAGALIQYGVINRRNFKWMAGLTNRLEALFSNISVGGISGGGAPDWIYRLGPNTGFATSIGQNLEFVMDIEMGFAVTAPNPTYLGGSAGIAFGL